VEEVKADDQVKAEKAGEEVKSEEVKPEEVKAELPGTPAS
jgi:hypothetical protein